MALITSQPKNPILHNFTTVHRAIPRLTNSGSFSNNAITLKVSSFNSNSNKLSLKTSPFGTVPVISANAALTEALEPAEEEGNVKYKRILLPDVEVKRERQVFIGRKWNSLDLGTAGVVLAMHVLSICTVLFQLESFLGSHGSVCCDGSLWHHAVFPQKSFSQELQTSQIA